MNWIQESQHVAGFKVVTQPAALDFFLLGTFPNLTDGRASTVPAAFSTPEFHHRAQDPVTFIVTEVLTKRVWGDEFRKLVISCSSEFLSQISCEVRNRTGKTIAVSTVQTTKNYKMLIVFHYAAPTRIPHITESCLLKIMYSAKRHYGWPCTSIPSEGWVLEA